MIPKVFVAATETATNSEPLTVAAGELVRRFHRVFHNVENHAPQSKELNQAVSLIARYGPERARYIVDFSQHAAEETRYKPQTFGGILQYTSRALAQHERNYRAQQQSERIRLAGAEETRTDELRRQEWSRILQGRPPDEYQERFEKAKRELFDRSPWLASREQSLFTERMIQACIIDQLEQGQTPTREPSVSSIIDREAPSPADPTVSTAADAA